MTTHAPGRAAELDDLLHDEHAHVHHENFITRYFFSRDHKRIGIQFLFASLFFFVIGGLLAIAISLAPRFPSGRLPDALDDAQVLPRRSPCQPHAVERGLAGPSSTTLPMAP